MPELQQNRPRGINFILGGSLVAAFFVGFYALGGSLDLGGFGAPSVRIESAEEFQRRLSSNPPQLH